MGCERFRYPRSFIKSGWYLRSPCVQEPWHHHQRAEDDHSGPNSSYARHHISTSGGHKRRPSNSSSLASAGNRRYSGQFSCRGHVSSCWCTSPSHGPKPQYHSHKLLPRNPDYRWSGSSANVKHMLISDQYSGDSSSGRLYYSSRCFGFFKSKRWTGSWVSSSCSCYSDPNAWAKRE